MRSPTHRARSTFAALAAVLAAILFAGPISAEDPAELIVLLASGPFLPKPAEIIESINAKGPLPGLLEIGEPVSARFLLPYRAQGKFGLWLEKNPDEPRAHLERYLVIGYPSEGAKAAAESALRDDPAVLAVGSNRRMELFAIPNDPYFQNTGDPLTYQWGPYLLNLPAAWDWAKGHAYIGIADVGIQGQDATCGLPGGETGHPDLRAFQQSGSSFLYQGGNFRQSLSRDFGNPIQNPPDTCVDELQPEVIGGVPRTATRAGHGTHVAGIVAATAGNSIGVAGTSWHSSLMIAKFDHLASGVGGTWIHVSDTADIVASICWLVDKGAQVINMSFGTPAGTYPTCFPTPSSSDYDCYCKALADAASRGVTLVAASGNDRSAVAFPARDPRVLAVGGLSYPGVFWNDPANNVGSNFGSEQDLAAPAAGILSTFYENQSWNANPGKDCYDANFSPVGYGRCTGTSMASPFVSGVAGLIRSTNPLLSEAQVRQSLTTNASQATNWTPQLGYGWPNAAASVSETLGKAAGQTPVNRLTPLFSLYSPVAEDFFYTSVPQMAAAAIEDIDGAYYLSAGPTVPGYPSFPGIPPCQTSPCDPEVPAASIYLLTTENSPVPGKSLVPLIRMSFRGPNGSNAANRDMSYAIDTPGMIAARNVGYQLDGVEGYLFAPCLGSGGSCSPSCAPTGTVGILRRYNPARDDHAIFPENELGQYTDAGYTVLDGATCLGYAYPNLDSDGDTVINGYEGLLGTNPSSSDSDCDGLSDGQEVLAYPPTDPRGTLCKSAQIVSQTVPTTMIAGQTYAVSVTVKNTGGQTWSPVGPQCNAYRLAQVGSSGWWPNRVELPANMTSGQQVTLNFNVVAPATTGTPTFQVQVVQECVMFLPNPGPAVTVNVQPSSKQAMFVSQSVPASMTAGQPYTATVTFKNSGTLTWSPIGPQCNAYRLAQIGNAAWSPTRVELPSALAPGQQATLTFSGTAPATPAQYLFQTRMVHECVEFFGDLSPSVTVNVTP